MRVAAGGFHLNRVLSYFKDRDVKSAAPEIINHDLLVFLFVHAVSQSRGGWFINNAADFEAGNFSGVFSGLSLRVVKIRGNGNDRLFYFFSPLCLSIRF